MGDGAVSEKEKKRLEKEQRRQQLIAEGKIPASKTAKPKLSKKERRELQEKQKSDKAQRQPSQGKKQPQKPPPAKKQHATKPQQRSEETNLFSHLRQFSQETSSSLKIDHSKIHPAIASLGLQYSKGTIRGANARVVAMLLAFKEVIRDYTPPEKTSIARDFDRKLKPMIQFLISCRPHSITMGNAIKHIRHVITTLPPEMTKSEAEEELCAVIDTYINSNITVAQEEIVKLGVTKVNDGDTILTFGRSYIIEKVLLAAHKLGVKFTVVIVSCRPKEEGRTLVRNLAEAGINCAFILLNSMSYMMASVTKVLLGAEALMSNGTILGRAGTALVAMMASSFNKPVLVVAETHKFTESVQLDSICYNELGDPNDLVLQDSWDGSSSTKSELSGWNENPQLKLLNLTYDLTPQNYITMVITEFGMLPTTSVPVIVREKEQ